MPQQSHFRNPTPAMPVIAGTGCARTDATASRLALKLFSLGPTASRNPGVFLGNTDGTDRDAPVSSVKGHGRGTNSASRDDAATARDIRITARAGSISVVPTPRGNPGAAGLARRPSR